jgi:hypothetical protein
MLPVPHLLTWTVLRPPDVVSGMMHWREVAVTVPVMLQGVDPTMMRRALELVPNPVPVMVSVAVVAVARLTVLGDTPVMVGVLAEFQANRHSEALLQAAGTLLTVTETVLGDETGRRRSSVGMGPRKMSEEPLTAVDTEM